MGSVQIEELQEQASEGAQSTELAKALSIQVESSRAELDAALAELTRIRAELAHAQTNLTQSGSELARSRAEAEQLEDELQRTRVGLTQLAGRRAREVEEASSRLTAAREQLGAAVEQLEESRITQRQAEVRREGLRQELWIHLFYATAA